MLVQLEALDILGDLLSKFGGRLAIRSFLAILFSNSLPVSKPHLCDILFSIRFDQFRPAMQISNYCSFFLKIYYHLKATVKRVCLRL